MADCQWPVSLKLKEPGCSPVHSRVHTGAQIHAGEVGVSADPIYKLELESRFTLRRKRDLCSHLPLLLEL